MKKEREIDTVINALTAVAGVYLGVKGFMALDTGDMYGIGVLVLGAATILHALKT